MAMTLAWRIGFSVLTMALPTIVFRVRWPLVMVDFHVTRRLCLG
ncbi:MAG: hypothetical protein OXT01_08215 [Rhodospirillaceae bacterium]|nr:hypothetical protein [Rhodospirillaceae bacterium]